MSGYIGKEALGALADGSVSTVKLADGAVTAAKIADGTIVAAEIASGAVTSAKMDTNIAVSGTLQGTVITATTGFAPDAQDGAYLGTSSLQFSDLFLADSATISLGDDAEVTLTHVHNTGLLLNGAMQLQFSDSSQFINAPSATVLDINATDEVEINATLADVNANLDVSGTSTLLGVVTTGGGIISDTTNTDALGSASVTWADAYLGDGAVINLGEDQDVTLTHVADTGILLNGTRQIQFNDASQYISGSSNADLDIAATTDINLNCTTVDINAAANISGAATITGVLTTGGGIISDTTNTDKLGSTSVTWADAYLGDGAVLAFGEDQDVTFTHVADTGVLLNSTMAIQFNDASQFINAPSNAILDITATDEIELNATAIDLNGTLDVSGTLTGVALTLTGAFTSLGIDDNADAIGVTIDSGERVCFSTSGIFNNYAYHGTGGQKPWMFISNDGTTGTTSNENMLIISNDNDTTGNMSGIGFGWVDTDDNPTYISGMINCVMGAATGGQYRSGELSFATSSATNNAPTEKMRLEADGTLNLYDNVLERPVLKDYGETKVALTPGSGVTIDVTAGNVFTLTAGQNTAFTFSNPPASGTAGSFTLIWTQGSSNWTTDWDTNINVHWAGGGKPDVTQGAGKVDIYTFFTIDGGTIWFGFQPGADMLIEA